jgi:2-oxoglutarate dehydrogenase complex dehydrogenase (E1) component-like enzyme
MVYYLGMNQIPKIPTQKNSNHKDVLKAAVVEIYKTTKEWKKESYLVLTQQEKRERLEIVNAVLQDALLETQSKLSKFPDDIEISHIKASLTKALDVVIFEKTKLDSGMAETSFRLDLGGFELFVY